MHSRLRLVVAALVVSATVTSVRAEEGSGASATAPLAAVGEPAQPSAPPAIEHDGGALRIAPQATTGAEAGAPSPLLAALEARLAVEPAGLTAPEIAERSALADFYTARRGAPLWLDTSGTMNARSAAAREALAAAADWGLEPAAFALPPKLGAGAALASIADQADAELALSLAVLKYARHARGGRILDPTTDLSSYLDRKPQLLDAKLVLERIAATSDVAGEMAGFNPRHAEFQRLREAWLTARNPKTGRADSAEAKRLLANMEQWRWMPDDLGEVHVEANLPEYTLRVVKNGEVIFTEKIVIGQVEKQTPVFSRPMKKIVFRPKWHVPESIKVRELWPSLLRGGGQMRAFGLELEGADGQPVDWRRLDWTKTDIRKFDVVQPPGPRSVLGQVKFAFPSQHTVFMHDTRDKHLFAARQRTFSHGCMRVRNPLLYAEVLLREDKGWDAARIHELATTGPLDNAIALDKRINVHMTYFTARPGPDGKIKTFPDVYGHERRITQALEGKWSQIAKGRDHLAPVPLDLAAGPRQAAGARRVAADASAGQQPGNIFQMLFGSF